MNKTINYIKFLNKTRKGRGITSKDKIKFYIKNNCIICSYSPDKDGYPRITMNKKRYRMSRYFYSVLKNKIPENYLIRHICHNRKCVNIDHLITGTAKQNTNDMILAGRMPQGSKRYNSKLKEKDILNIRKDSRSAKILAMEYKVCKPLIYYIKNRKRWTFL